MTADSRLIAALEPLVRRVRTDVTATKSNGRMAWTREPLTEPRLAKHLNGGPARGVAPIKPGESVTMVGMLDLDSHKGETPWPEMTAAAMRVLDELDRRFMAPVVFRSSGGHGIHIYVVWDEPQDARSVRAELTEALAAVGFENGASGVSQGQIEVFPKQDRVDVGRHGNQFILPLAGESELLEPLLGLEPMGDKLSAVGLDWPASAPVPVRQAEERRALTVESSGDLERFKQALSFVKNEGLSYEQWRDHIYSIHHASGGSDEGYELALAFSEQSPLHRDEAELRDKIWNPARNRDGGITERFVIAKAQALGFERPSPDEFEIIKPAPAEPPPLPAFNRDGKGKIEATVTNTVLAVRRPDVAGLQVAYDEFRDEITVAQPETNGWRAMTDADAVSVRMAMERVGFKAAPKELARDACVLVASENRYDSAQLWLGALQWDGVERCAGFLRDFMGCEDTPYHRAVSLYLWTALAGRVLSPGVKADMVPIYEGAQGLRKSSAIEALSPAPEFFVEIDLGQKEEDTVRKLRGALVGEIAELSGLHTRALEDIKKFVVRKVEKWVPKYKEFPSTFARRLVFIGTTNRTDILADETGNRRWLPVHITSADVEGIIAAREQLWAEGAALFKRYGVMWAQAERLGVEEHAAYTIEDSWGSAIEKWLASGDDFDESATPVLNGDRHFTTADVLSGALHMPPKDVRRTEQTRVCAILRTLGYEQKAARLEGKVTRAWSRARVTQSEVLATDGATLVALR